MDETNSGAKLELSWSPLSSTKRTTEKMPPSAFLTPSTLPHLVEVARGERRRRGLVALGGRAGGDRDVRARVGHVEDLVERLVDRVREDIAAGDEGNAEQNGQGRDGGAQLARHQAPEETLVMRPPSSTRSRHWRCRADPSCTIWPSRSTIEPVGVRGGLGVVRDHHDASGRGRRPTGAACSSTSSLDLESRLPVGSSANTTAGLDTSARATATRCCWPPDSSAGWWVRRSPRPTVSTSRCSHSSSTFGRRSTAAARCSPRR